MAEPGPDEPVAPAGLLGRVSAIVDRDLAPLASRIDREGLYPEAVLRALGQAGAFAAHGGADPGAGGLWAAVDAMSRVGRECLTTAFCTWCQDALVWYLACTENGPLRERRLADAAWGRALGGTGLSNPLKAEAGLEPLRLSARRVAGGWVVHGALPWVSNLGPEHAFGTVAGTDRGRRIMILVDRSTEGVSLAGDTRFVALDGTRTYGVRFRDAFVPDHDVLAEDAGPFLARVRPGFVLLQAGMAFGLIRGCLDVMARAGRAHAHANRFLPDQPATFEEALQQLAAQVAALCRTPFDPAPEYRRRVLRARLEAGEWTLRAAQAAMLHAGASGYVKGSAAERRLREAFFVAIVTPALKHLRLALAAP